MEQEKRCVNCGAAMSPDDKFCTYCGSADFQTVAPAQPVFQPAPPVYNPVAAQVAPPVSENVVAGVVGSFLFALLGGLLYFIVYQFGFVAGICGLVTFVLAHFGYGRFSGLKNQSSTAGLVTSIIMTVLVILLAEYLCLSYEIYNVFKDEYSITFFDAVRATPDFLAEKEVLWSVLFDLAFSFLMGGIAIVGQIVSKRKAKKNQPQPPVR